MDQWSFYDRAAETIPFQLKGYNGKVSIYYGANDDPRKAGFDSLPGRNFDIALCQGYPIIHARIESYEGSGYRTLCGWIQIVTSQFLDSYDQEKAKTETYASVDTFPAFQEFDIPFASYGTLPQLLDAPCLNLGRYAQLRWTADTFLTTIPMRSKDEEISWLLGFRWGYMENDIPNEKPIVLPLEVTTSQVWNNHLPALREQYMHWKFKEA